MALLLHASALHPNLPIYPPQPKVVNIDIATLEPEDADLYEEFVDELPYPKAGHGIQLRPESEDLDILVDENVAGFSHCWKGIAEMMHEAGWPPRGDRGLMAQKGVRTANGVGLGHAHAHAQGLGNGLTMGVRA